jgi:hypothetical protein
MRAEDPGEPRDPGWGIWVLMGLATLGAVAGVVGSFAALFGFLG